MKTDTKEYRGVYGIVVRHPRLILAMALLISLLAIVVTKQRLQFLTGRDQLMPANTSFNRDYRAYRAEFGDQEEIAVVIESSDSALAGRFGERLAERLTADRKHFREVFFPFGLPFFQQNGLLLMPREELATFTANLTKAAPTLKALAAAPSVQTLFTHLTGEMDGLLAAPAASAEQKRLDRLVFMLGALGDGIGSFTTGGGAGLSLESVMFRRADGSESSFAAAGRQQVLTVLPVKDESSFMQSAAAIATLRAEIASLRKLPEFAGVSVGITGTPVLEHEEMVTSERDITLATAITIILTVILLLVAFRGVLNTVAAMLALGVAICCSFGFATLAIGHLNILSSVFAVMLIGIGIEYGIQVILRMQEELGRGAGKNEALRIALARNGWAITMAAATVAAAFATFAFTDFKGIAELGIIAAGGVVICVIVTFTVLPALLVLFGTGDRGLGTGEKQKPSTIHHSPFTEGAARVLFGRPRAVLAVALVLSLACVYPLARSEFDYNLMNLQARGGESVTYAYKLMRSKENAGYFAVVMAATEAEAAEKARRLEKLPTVDHVVWARTFVPDDQAEKLRNLATARQALDGIKTVPYEEDLRLMELPSVFEDFRARVVKLKSRLEQEKRPEAKPVGTFLATLDRFFASLEKKKDTTAVGMLKDFQGGMFAEMPGRIAMLRQSLAASPVQAADVPPQLMQRFIGKTGKYLLQVAPKEEIFAREPLKRFLDDVRSVDPAATGEPVMVYESMTVLRDSYRNAFFYAIAAIAAILLIAFRSVRYALIGLVPLAVGLLFMVAGMGLFGISFNSANVIVLPLVLGIAVDSGIYLINRYRREDETPRQVVLSSTGVGVFLNTLTIMASFGALMVARHQGVFSIGAVMCLGMVACQIAFIVVLPAVLELAGKK
ncbi:MMPL family transporter [Geomobilimonas luticola]|uniref:MMPL family transporter n=1 Tax=Geomobilimonas luticola TaxID=1114878 RepID=A0ABS5SG26_9BACT|nr:MMPL family transporter [Geomobilimonas luticola]MBT0654315.1 MMPL family transporter [Geomobilimonas luticola]